MSTKPDGREELEGESEPHRYVTQPELAARWRRSERTLEGWRLRKRGPAFLRLEGRILYPLADVEAYEAEHLEVATRLAAINADSGWGATQDADLPTPGTGDQP